MDKIKDFLRDNDNSVVIKNITGSLLIKGIAMIVSIYSMAAYLSYFNNTSYLGVWLTIVSIINWILVFDLGIGNGLRNYVTKLFANDEKKKIKVYITSAYVSLGAVSFIGLLTCIVLSYTLNWNQILNVSENMISPNVLCNIMAISFANIFIRFFLNLIISILYALQKTFVINLIALVTNISLLVYLLISNPINDITALYKLSLVQLLISNVPLLIVSLLIFASVLQKARPNLKYYNAKAAKQVLGLGGGFFIVQVEMMSMNATNEFLINNLFGPSYVVDYLIYFKIFSVASMVFAIISQPIWSAITKYVNAKDFTKIKTYSNLMSATAALGFLSCIIVVFILPNILSAWLGEKAITVTIQNGLIFAMYIGSLMFMNASTCIANGFGRIKTQMIYLFFAVIIKFGVSFLLCKNWSEVILITAVLQFGMAITQEIVNRKTLKRYQNNQIVIYSDREIPSVR